MPTIRHGFHIASKQLAYLIIILLVVLMVSAGLVYWLSAQVEQRQDEISAWASEQIGDPVEIGQAGIDWLGVLPKLQLEAIKIIDEQDRHVIISLDKLYVGLDIIASIKQSTPVLNDLTLAGLSILLDRTKAGKFQLKGLDIPETSSAQQQWLTWLKILNRFDLQSIIVNYSDQLSPELSGKYHLTNAILSHESDQWTMAANIRLPSLIGQQLQFEGEAEANFDSLDMSKWQWQVKTSNLQLAPLAKQFTWQDISVQRGSADIKLSAIGHGEYFESLIADVALSKSTIVSGQQTSPQQTVIIDHFSGILDWQNQPQSWQLSGRGIQLHMNGEAWPSTAFTVRKHNDDSWLFIGDYIRLSDITSIASLSKHSPEILRQQKPAGDLEMVNLRYSTLQGVTALTFNLRDGVFESWNDYPGVTGLTADIKWNHGLATINFDSHDLTLYADKWLEDAVFFDSVSGVLDLQLAENTWLAQSDKLRIWNDDLTLQLDGQIEQQADGEIINAIKIKLEEIAIARWQNYIPQKILSDSFKEWSKTAFQAGKIVDGNIEWVGKLSSFPYQDNADGGFFNMLLNVEEVQLHYASAWPDLFAVTGTIEGHGHDLIIKSQQGKIAGFNFTNVTTVINKLAQDDPILSVDGDLTGSSKQAALFLQNSPLNERFGSTVKSIKLSGGSNIHLNLLVPLTEPDETQASGFVSFIQSTLTHSALDMLSLENINGQLRFDNKGLFAEKISAKLFNEAINIHVEPDDDYTKIIVEGKLATKELKAFWPDKLPTFISGQAGYKVDITVVEKTMGDFYLNTELTSNLKGIDIDMPEPFTKTQEDERSFTATMNNIDNEPVYSFQYGQQLNVIAAPNNEGLRAVIKFGQGQATLPNTGIKVRGKLAELSIDDWLIWSKDLAPTKNNNLLSSIDDVSMTIDSLAGFEQRLTSLNYSMNKGDQGWQVNINSDQSKGKIYWPADFNGQLPLDFNLDRLVLTLPKPTDNDVTKTESELSLWPAMNINIRSLIVDDINLGALTLQASRSAQIWSIDSASLRSEVFNAEIINKSTFWQQSALQQNSSIALQIKSDDLGALLTNFGYQRVIEAETNKLTVDLDWPDHPAAFSKAKVLGQINVKIGEGQLNEVEPGAAGRIFGLMSIAALPRRLSLDFSDLFSSGFSFDSIKGDFNLANGQAVTNNLTLKGTAAKIEMTGPVDLVNHRYDQQVKVTPNVSSALPLAGAVAGGPVGLGVGAVLLVVDKLSGKLFGKNIVNLISYNYNLTGPWQDPQLTVVTASKAVTPALQ